MTDTVFMSSRDGQRFRLWGESIIRPGLSPLHWCSRTNLVAWGVVETQAEKAGVPRELSIYVDENTEHGGGLRRYAYRMDGFVSVQAPLSGGEVVTKPLVFEGKRLVLNVSTSAAGNVRLEIQDESGRPLSGYSLRDSEMIYGDSIERVVNWRQGEDLGALAGRAVRLRFVLQDADVFSFQFRD